jgi:RHS repeat-associated protein
MSVLEPIRSRGSGAAGIVHGNEWSWFNHARYDASNRRVWKLNANGEAYYLYDLNGENLGTFTPQINADPTSLYLQPVASQERAYFFGKKLFVTEDNVGSALGVPTLTGHQSFYPYGEQKSGTAATEQFAFATYWEDSETGLDYAMNRYYSSTLGRFLSPDPYRGSMDARSPQTFNRYAYADGDPIGEFDPSGLGTCSDGSQSPLCVTVTAPIPPSAYDASLTEMACNGMLLLGTNAYDAAAMVMSGAVGACQAAAVTIAAAGSGSGTSGLAISDEIMREEWYNGLELAIRTLKNNSNCADLFGLTGPYGNSSPAPEAVLSQISNSYSFAPIASPEGYITNATTTGTGSTAMPVGNNATILVNTAVTITVNNTTPGAAFVSGNMQSWAGVILHELGHAYWDLYGPGTSAIAPDGSNAPPGVNGDQASINNQTLINKTCGL